MNYLQQVLWVAGATLLVSASVQAEDWTLAKDEAGIQVFLSAVPGSPYKQYRAVTTVRADIATLRALQEDVQAACAWIYECEEQKLLKSAGAESWTYARFAMPWPVTPRDSVLHVTTSVAPDGTVTRLLEARPDYLPTEKGFVRVARIDGFWTLQVKGAGKVEVVYQVHTEPGGSVPSWLANSFVVDAPFNTLQAFRAAAEKR